MNIRPILVFPNPILRAKTIDVYDFDASLLDLVIDMEDTMASLHALGLAAPQIGDTRRVIVLKADPKPLVFCNPVVRLQDGAELIEMTEGCLSFPGVTVDVERWNRVYVSGRDVEGRAIAHKAEGAMAHAAQHELDHLDGRLLIDMAGTVQREMIRRKFKKSPPHAARVDHLPKNGAQNVR